MKYYNPLTQKKINPGKVGNFIRERLVVILCSVVPLILVGFSSRSDTLDAPCSGVYFKVDLWNYPCDYVVDPSHYLYIYGDENNNDIPDEMMLSSNQQIPEHIGYRCTGIPVFACLVAYNRSDVEIGSDGMWRPKYGAVPICVIRYFEE